MRRQSLVVLGIGTLLATGSIVVAATPQKPAPATTGSVSGKLIAEGASSPLVVYIETATVPAAPRSDKPKLVQRNTQFQPGATVVVQGQSVEFPNEDKFYHNVFSVTKGNEFDLGLFRGGISKSAKMKKAGEVDVYCNIHPDMVAKVLVLQNDFWAQAAADGKFAIQGIPAGKYTLVAWSKDYEPVRREVEIKAGGELRVDFAMKQKRVNKPHKKKDGGSYGRYE